MVTKKSSVLGKISVVSLLMMFSLISPSAAFADGLLDTTFGGDGLVTTDVSARTDEAYSVVVQSDGKIIVAGFSDTGVNDDFAVARYNTDGSLDGTFGTGGIVKTDFNLGTGSVGDRHDRANSVVVQSDGKIVVAGYASDGSKRRFAVARYNTDGSPDGTFGTGGKVTTTFVEDVSVVHSGGNSVVVQSDGKIVVAGTVSDSATGGNFAVVRYTTAGSIDTDFGTGGKVTTDISSVDEAYSVVLQNDGKIVVAGYASIAFQEAFAVVRYTTAGVLDGTFGTGGKVTEEFTAGNSDVANSVVLQSDGKIVVAGYARIGDNRDFAVVRYTTAGVLDGTFGTGGKVTTDNAGLDDLANSVVVQRDGKIVVAGTSDSGAERIDFAVARYNTDGSIDESFGTDGIVTTAFGVLSAEANSVVVQSDGKIVVAGTSDSGDPEIGDNNLDFAVARYSVTVSGGDSSSNELIWVGAQSTSCPAPNPWVKEKLGFATNAKPVLSSAENSVGKTITRSSYDALKTSGVAFDTVSKKVSTATETLPIYGCKDKLLSGKINQPIQFIAGGYTLQSDAHGYINTADQKWHDINAVTLYTNTAAFMHTVKFTKAGKYVVVLTEQPDTSGGLIPTYGVRSIRFVINVN